MAQSTSLIPCHSWIYQCAFPGLLLFLQHLYLGYCARGSVCPIEYPLPRFLCSRQMHRRGSAPSMPKFCVPLSLKKWDLLKAPCYKYPQCSATHPTSFCSNALQDIQRHVKSARFSNCPFQTTFAPGVSAHISDVFKLLGV